MPIDPEKFKQDERSPQELAKAILDHEFRPGGGKYYSLTFRERLLMDYQSDGEVKHAPAMLWVLKELEEGLPILMGRKDSLRYALQVIDVYKRESAHYRDDAIAEANRAFADLDTHPPRAYPREVAEEAETLMLEINNLNSIEK